MYSERQMERIPFETALEKTGFGLYNYLLTILSGFTVIAFSCVAYSSSIIVPVSACELGTTVAQQGMLAASPLLAAMAGPLIWGYLGDTRGRRKMLLVSTALTVIFNTLASLSVNWIMLMCLQFVTSLLSCGQTTLSVTLQSESAPLSKRSMTVLWMISIGLMSQGFSAALAIPVIPLKFSFYLPSLGIYWNSWRTLVVVYSLPSLVCFISYFFTHESPKFLFTKGREDEAVDVLKAIYRANHRTGDEFQVKGLLEDQSEVTVVLKSRKDQLFPLFKAPLLKYTIIIIILNLFQNVGSFVIWLPTIANQFINMMNTGVGWNQNLCSVLDSAVATPADPDSVPCSLKLNTLLIVICVSMLQSSSNFIVSLVINRTGRRNMVIAITAVLGTCGIIINLIPNAVGGGILFIIFLMGIMLVGLYTALAVSLFPAYLRAMAVSVGLATSRVGSFAAIQILRSLLIRHCDLGFYLFSTILALSALVAMLLPDDRLQLKSLKNTDKKEEKLTRL